MKILVLAAHPDDEVLGMGGTIKKFTKTNHTVKIVIFATGISSRRSSNFKNSTNYVVNKKINSEMNKQIKNRFCLDQVNVDISTKMLILRCQKACHYKFVRIKCLVPH